MGEEIIFARVYPAGALLQNKTSGGVYFVQDAIKHPIPSREIMTTYFPGRKIFKVLPSELSEYQTGAPVMFEDGTLAGVKNTDEVYLISGGLRRPLRDREVLKGFGWTEDLIIWTTRKGVEVHPVGQPIEPLEIEN